VVTLVFKGLRYRRALGYFAELLLKADLCIIHPLNHDKNSGSDNANDRQHGEDSL
jgi:hypothetical protein